MVHLTDAANEFTARVLVAKLGSAGILAEVRGLCSPYPNLSAAHVWVEADEYADARELISADLDDELAVAPSLVADGLVADGLPAVPRPVAEHRLLRPVLLAVALLLLGSFALPRCTPAAVVATR
jgi:hypothetical protein